MKIKSCPDAKLVSLIALKVVTMTTYSTANHNKVDYRPYHDVLYQDGMDMCSVCLMTAHNICVYSVI